MTQRAVEDLRIFAIQYNLSCNILKNALCLDDIRINAKYS